MRRLLHIIASPRLEHSSSEAIAAEFLDQYTKLNPSAEIDTLDLWKEPIPAFDADKVAARMTFHGVGVLEGKIKEAWAEVVEVAGRFIAADDYLITVPMWNGGIPWQLKQYVDTITQPGLTFGFGPDGFIPLLKNKRAMVIYTTGIYSPGLAEGFGTDFQSTYIKWWLKLIGVSEIHSVEYYGNIINPEKEKLKKQAFEEAVYMADKHFA